MKPIAPTVQGGTFAADRGNLPFILVARYGGTSALLFYGPELASTSRISGFVHSHFVQRWCSAPDPATYNGFDRGSQSVESTYLWLTPQPAAPLLSGTIRYASATYAIVGGELPGSMYDAGTIAAISDMTGQWSMTDERGEAVVLSIDATGVVTGTARGCSLVGTVQSDQEGLNLLRLQVTSLCPLAAPNPLIQLSYDGFALAMPMRSGATQLLVWAESTGWDFDYVLAIGRR